MQDPTIDIPQIMTADDAHKLIKAGVRFLAAESYHHVEPTDEDHRRVQNARREVMRGADRLLGWALGDADEAEVGGPETIGGGAS